MVLNYLAVSFDSLLSFFNPCIKLVSLTFGFICEKLDRDQAVFYTRFLEGILFIFFFFLLLGTGCGFAKDLRQAAPAEIPPQKGFPAFYFCGNY